MPLIGILHWGQLCRISGVWTYHLSLSSSWANNYIITLSLESFPYSYKYNAILRHRCLQSTSLNRCLKYFFDEISQSRLQVPKWILFFAPSSGAAIPTAFPTPFIQNIYKKYMYMVVPRDAYILSRILHKK